MSLLTVCLPAVGLLANVVFQTAWVRLRRQTSVLRSVYAGFLFGAALICGLEPGARGAPATAAELAGGLLVNLVIYGLLSYDYFHFINLGVTGRRVRLVRELYEAPEGLTLEEILDRYNAKEMVQNRLGRLMRSGQVVLEDGRYRLGSPVMAYISRVILAMKKIVLGRGSEFEG